MRRRGVSLSHPWSTALLQNPTVAQLIKKLKSSLEPESLLQESRNSFFPEANQSSLYPVCFIRFNIIPLPGRT